MRPTRVQDFTENMEIPIPTTAHPVAPYEVPTPRLPALNQY